jgi:tRNA threonylcarbamoyladenosine biosynthesis protein TsaB
MTIDADLIHNLIAIDTGTDTLSIAVRRGDGGETRLWQYTAPGGANASVVLIPALQDLMAQAGLQFCDVSAIAFGAGPGSFTGLRTACSVAQGLAFAVNVPVLGVDSLLAVAETARWQRGLTEAFSVTAMLDARMDEIYTADYFFDGKSWHSTRHQRVILPEHLDGEGDWLAGNVFATYGDGLPLRFQHTPRETALPTAAAMLRLAPALLAGGYSLPAAQALPTYIRDKVAYTTQEPRVRQLMLLTN